MITTIQISDKAKKALDRLRKEKESYEEIIVNLMNSAEKQKRNQEDLLIEGCKEMYSDMLKISEKWESTLMDGLDKNEKWD